MYGPEEGYPPLQPLQPAALQHIREWMDDPAPPSPVMWLGGSSVVVRSAAAQKIVEIYQASDRFAASFFFRGGRDEDDQTRALVTTISYQVATNVDALRAPIDAVITADPSVLDKSLDAQFQALVVGPFVEADSLRLPQFLVVIDGLGEVVRQESQVYILELIASAVGTSKIPLRFLISSPEPHVKSTLGLNPYIGSSQTILLDDYNSSKVAVSALDAASVPSQLINSHSDNSSRPILRRLLPSSKRPVRHTKHNSLDSFPKLVTVRSANGHAESYSRSLMMTGNGFPLWYPGGDIGKPMEHLRRGVSIGDVGILDSDGLFDFCFNIFLPPDNPVHAGLVPVGFRPIEPALEPSEIEMIPEHFKPGHVITSQGITVTTKSSNPLSVPFHLLEKLHGKLTISLRDIYFSSVDREGGVVILPNGGSRENLIKTDRIHEYAKRNAPYWYQDVNGYGGVVHTNGSLLLVTGCDKTDDWALASFPYYTGGKAPLNLRYTQQPDHGDPWIDNNSARTSFYEPSQARPITSGAGTRHQCVFVRGMRISLSDKSWRETMPPSESARLFYTFILRSPSALELLVDNLLVYLRLRMSERRAMSKVTPGRLVRHYLYLLNMGDELTISSK